MPSGESISEKAPLSEQCRHSNFDAKAKTYRRSTSQTRLAEKYPTHDHPERYA